MPRRRRVQAAIGARAAGTTASDGSIIVSPMSDDSVTVSHDVGGRQLQMWGALEILEEIGRGGFGVVYRAWEPALAREVALKVIRPRDPNPETLASILREGQLLARVRHANVVAVHGAQQIGDEVGLWMEFVRGRSLSNLVRADGPRAAEEAAVIGISLCQALAAVHQAGVLHRDIKAHNVMREAGGRIVLMDFGAGQLLEGPRNQDERAIGTPSYMAPEVLAGGRATARSDLYSLGILLYYLVTGTFPVEGTSWTDNWHNVRVVRFVEDGLIQVYFDDMKTPVMTAVDKTFTWGRVGVGSFDDTGNWDDVKVRGIKVEKK